MNPLNNFISSGIEELDSLLKFTAEIDKMSSILRRTILLDGSRRENDAEHSWHIAVMAMIFEKYFNGHPDTRHAVEMLLVHDLVEIYAGDTFAYDEAGNRDKAARETAAADKLFAILPPESGSRLRGLWEEFDARITPEARYANCLDRLQPFFHNALTGGHTWKNSSPRTTARQVRQRMAVLETDMPALVPWVEKVISNALANGHLVGQESPDMTEQAFQ